MLLALAGEEAAAGLGGQRSVEAGRGEEADFPPSL